MIKNRYLLFVIIIYIAVVMQIFPLIFNGSYYGDRMILINEIMRFFSYNISTGAVVFIILEYYENRKIKASDRLNSFLNLKIESINELTYLVDKIRKSNHIKLLIKQNHARFLLEALMHVSKDNVEELNILVCEDDKNEDAFSKELKKINLIDFYCSTTNNSKDKLEIRTLSIQIENSIFYIDNSINIIFNPEKGINGGGFFITFMENSKISIGYLNLFKRYWAESTKVSNDN